MKQLRQGRAPRDDRETVLDATLPAVRVDKLLKDLIEGRAEKRGKSLSVYMREIWWHIARGEVILRKKRGVPPVDVQRRTEEIGGGQRNGGWPE
jgi:hypothetical protein